MARKSKGPTPPRPVEIGEYYATSIFDDWYVFQKTGPGWNDYKHGPACASERGARQLAALMNQAKHLARDWRSVKSGTPWRDCKPEAWAVHCIASAVCDAIDCPKPEGLGTILASDAVKAEAARDAA